MRRSMTLLAAVAAPLALAAPAAAHDVAGGHGAGGYTVQAGELTRGPLPYAIQNAFMPATVKVHVGDTVTWTTMGGHTVTFLGNTKPEQLPFIGPDPAGSTYAGINDAAGQPFYFNGLPKFVFNGRVFGPIGSNVVRDRKLHSQGVFGQGPKKPGKVSFRFTKPGVYRYVCVLHPGMQGAVRVLPKAAKIPTPATVKARGKAQEQRNWALARKLDKVKPPANTILAGVGDTTTLMAFKPEVLTVKAGTTVRVQGGSSSEPHNVAFGPKDWITSFLRATDLFPESPNGPNQLSPVHVYGTEPERPQVYTGVNHGNGFLVSPAVDGSKVTPLTGRTDVTFTTPGTYTYYCAIHYPDMKATIIVTP